MKYHGVCISVKDIKLATKFYQELFNLEISQDYGINVSFNGLSLQQEFDRIIGVPKKSMVDKSHNMELYFEVDHFDDFINRLKSRNDIVYLNPEISETSWGQRRIHFYDLDNHLIEVGENLTMVIQRFLDSGLSISETSQRMDISVDDIKTLLENKIRKVN